MRILVFDDDLQQARRAYKQLKDHKVIRAKYFSGINGALSRLQTESPEVLLTDLMTGHWDDSTLMPYGVILAQHAVRMGVPVAIVSASGFESQKPWYQAFSTINGVVIPGKWINWLERRLPVC
ncbi:MAG: hypothetical protein AAB483_04090 [Patescibacteria group bacterium]